MIITAFVLFICYIAFMVRGAMQSEVNLVSKDYYQQELEYGQRMDQLSQTQALAQPLTIVHAAAAEQVSLVFPEAFKGQKLKGNVRFFRPSDSQQDIEVALALNSDLQQHISTAQLAKGFWRVEVSWQAEGQQYFMKQDLTLE